MMTKGQFLYELSQLRSGSTFLNLKGYRSEAGEHADYNIIFHISYENAVRRSLATLEAYTADSILQAQAKQEMILSFKTSLEKMAATPVEEIDDAYTRFQDADGSHIKGVKMHTETGILHLYGFAHQKVVHIPGTYKKVNSKPLTLEKKKLEKLCATSKFRQFRITPEQVEYIKVSHLSLLPPDSDDKQLH